MEAVVTKYCNEMKTMIQKSLKDELCIHTKKRKSKKVKNVNPVLPTKHLVYHNHLPGQFINKCPACQMVGINS